MNILIGILIGILIYVLAAAITRAIMGNKVYKRCDKCGRVFQLGLNGVGIGSDGYQCDACASVQRDPMGNAWFPDEQDWTFPDGGKITREDAFAGKK